MKALNPLAYVAVIGAFVLGIVSVLGFLRWQESQYSAQVSDICSHALDAGFRNGYPETINWHPAGRYFIYENHPAGFVDTVHYYVCSPEEIGMLYLGSSSDASQTQMNMDADGNRLAFTYQPYLSRTTVTLIYDDQTWTLLETR